jgi:hypothetical protein
MAEKYLGRLFILVATLWAGQGSANPLTEFVNPFPLYSKQRSVTPRILAPNLGSSYDFSSQPVDAAERCTAAAARNLLELGLTYGGVLELAPPDNSLVCEAKQVTEMFVHHRGKHKMPSLKDILAGKVLTPISDFEAVIFRSMTIRSQPLSSQIMQLDRGADSFKGQFQDAQQRLLELRPLLVHRKAVVDKLEAMKKLMRAGQPWPKATEMAEFVWPHKACLAAAKEANDDEVAAKLKFEQRRTHAVHSRPLTHEFTFYQDYLALVEGYARYKDPSWDPVRDDSQSRFFGWAHCKITPVRSMLLPFFVELRPEPPARGRRPLQALNDIDDTVAALAQLGKGIEADIEAQEGAKVQALRSLKSRALELLPQTKAALTAAQMAFDAISADKEVQQAVAARVKALTADLEQADKAYRELVENQAAIRALVEALRSDVAAKLKLRAEARETIKQAGQARRNLTLQCSGVVYANCKDKAAKDAYDKMLYELSERYTYALSELSKADSAWEKSLLALDKAREEQLTYPERVSAQREKISDAREALDKEMDAPPGNKVAQAKALAKATGELEDWKQLLARVQDSIAFAESGGVTKR